MRLAPVHYLQHVHPRSTLLGFGVYVVVFPRCSSRKQKLRENKAFTKFILWSFLTSPPILHLLRPCHTRKSCDLTLVFLVMGDGSYERQTREFTLASRWKKRKCARGRGAPSSAKFTSYTKTDKHQYEQDMNSQRVMVKGTCKAWIGFQKPKSQAFIARIIIKSLSFVWTTILSWFCSQTNHFNAMLVK